MVAVGGIEAGSAATSAKGSAGSLRRGSAGVTRTTMCNRDNSVAAGGGWRRPSAPGERPLEAIGDSGSVERGSDGIGFGSSINHLKRGGAGARRPFASMPLRPAGGGGDSIALASATHAGHRDPQLARDLFVRFRTQHRRCRMRSCVQPSRRKSTLDLMATRSSSSDNDGRRGPQGDPGAWLEREPDALSVFRRG